MASSFSRTIITVHANQIYGTPSSDEFAQEITDIFKQKCLTAFVEHCKEIGFDLRIINSERVYKPPTGEQMSNEELQNDPEFTNAIKNVYQEIQFANFNKKITPLVIEHVTDLVERAADPSFYKEIRIDYKLMPLVINFQFEDGVERLPCNVDMLFTSIFKVEVQPGSATQRAVATSLASGVLTRSYYRRLQVGYSTEKPDPAFDLNKELELLNYFCDVAFDYHLNGTFGSVESFFSCINEFVSDYVTRLMQNNVDPQLYKTVSISLKPRSYNKEERMVALNMEFEVLTKYPGSQRMRANKIARFD
jgi:hypothetical protein